LIIAMCEGLHCAHEAGISHRDIKPGNVLIDDEGVPKIVDFGLARTTTDKEQGKIFGTPGYTAPEVVKNPAAVDQKSDIFSIGVMLFELLIGDMPSKPGEKPSLKNDTDPMFDNIVVKATNPINTMRYKSAAAMAKDLKKLLAKLRDEDEDSETSSKLVSASDKTKRKRKAKPTLLAPAGKPKRSKSASVAKPVAMPASKNNNFVVMQVATIAVILLVFGIVLNLLGGDSPQQNPVQRPTNSGSNGVSSAYSPSSQRVTNNPVRPKTNPSNPVTINDKQSNKKPSKPKQDQKEKKETTFFGTPIR